MTGAGDELMKAVMNDSLNILSDFIPIPKYSIMWIYNKMQKNPVSHYLNINRDKIQQYYQGESHKHLELCFKGETEKLPQYLEIDNTINHLDMSHFMFEFHEGIFELEHEVKDQTQSAFTQLEKKLNYTNEENLRLSRLNYEDGVYTLHTQPVYYKSYLHSNMVMDCDIGDGQTFREIVHKDGQVEKLKNSQLANQLGINILVFTPPDMAYFDFTDKGF